MFSLKFMNMQVKCLAFDISNRVGFGVGIVIGLVLRNISEGCFKTTKLNKKKSGTVYRTMLGYGFLI